MKVTIELVIECEGEADANALDRVLLPDNRYFPKDQVFSASRRGRSLHFALESPRVRPAMTTVTSILGDAKLFQDVWVETS